MAMTVTMVVAEMTRTATDRAQTYAAARRASSTARDAPAAVMDTRTENAAAFVAAAHADHLAGASLRCGGAAQLLSFARSQVDYILGVNPGRISYMVGYGPRFPAPVHHRGASVPSIKYSPGKITCKGGFDYFSKSTPNPNVLVGAIVGGPDGNDHYNDSRQNFQQAEPSTVTVAPIVGVLARLLHN